MAAVTSESVTPTSTTKQKDPQERSISTYAVQCDKCLKWRIIDTLEEYEEIRSKLMTEPYHCERKLGVSCEDPADIEYNTGRTWVIDKPGLPKTPKGFKRTLIVRKDFSKVDAYYITPTGKKLRAISEAQAFIEAQPKYKHISLSDFNFKVPKVMSDTIPEGFIVKKTPASNRKDEKSTNRA